MPTILGILFLATLAACSGKPAATAPAETTDPTTARWHCIRYEDAPTDCFEDPCPEEELYDCIGSDVAWCFGKEDEAQGCAQTHADCDQRAVMALVNETETPAECTEMK